MSSSVKVAINLLVRLTNDLRSVSILAMMGYHTQAAVLVASMYETAFTILFINSDNALADQWINHEEPTRPFHNVWEMTKTGLRNMGYERPDEQAIVEYKV